MAVLVWAVTGPDAGKLRQLPADEAERAEAEGWGQIVRPGVTLRRAERPGPVPATYATREMRAAPVGQVKPKGRPRKGKP